MDREVSNAKAFSSWQGWLRASTDWMRPSQSLISNAPLPSGAAYRLHEFTEMEQLHPPYCACCSFPFERDEGEGALCAGCLVQKPLFGRARAPLVYSDTVSDLVLRLKRQGRRAGLSHFAQLMYASGRELVQEADLAIPVPLHYRRLAQRGFNQAGWLASALSRQTGLPVAHHVLRRVKASQSQGHLSPRQRRMNVAGAFAVPDKHRARVQGRRILLIDDVFTTGATVEACARALLRAKAANVDVLTLARVVGPKKTSI